MATALAGSTVILTGCDGGGMQMPSEESSGQGALTLAAARDLTTQAPAILLPKPDLPRPLPPPPYTNVPQSLKTRDFRLNPPVVKQVAVRPDGNGGSQLDVVFAPDPRLGTDLVIGEGRPIKLTRAEKTPLATRIPVDGVHFTGALPIAFGRVFKSHAQLLETLRQRRITTVPIFEGRQLVGRAKIPFELRDDVIILPTGGIPGLVDEARSLMITDPTVVEDPVRTGTPCGGNTSGVWSFKHLMEEMANEPVTGTNAADLTELWLQKWVANQTVNGFVANARMAMNNVLTSWPRLPDGKLNLAAAPFKLLAIVNRIDLAGNPSYGAVSGAEGRFVFELVDQNTCAPQSFLVIFEYGVPRNTCTEMRDWANQWLALDAFPIGTPAYNAALAAITEQFVARNSDPGKPNGSALNQLRTNEIALAAPWELREFRLLPLFPEVPLLRQDTVKQNPDASFNGTGALAAFVNANVGALIAGTHTVTPAWLGAAAPIPPFFWSAPGIVNNDARHGFSLATCSGCHGSETGTGFTHIGIAPIGSSAPLSGFLTGTTVNDPVSGVPRSFDDLAARAAKLQAFASASCSPFVFDDLVIKGELVRPIPPIDIRPVLMGH